MSHAHLLEILFLRMMQNSSFYRLCPRTPLISSHTSVLKFVLDDLSKPDLLVRDVPRPRFFWEVE